MSEANLDIQTAHSQSSASAPRKDAATQLAEQYRAVAGMLPGANVPEVQVWRDAAMAVFTAAGMPHRRIEEWKFTDLRALMPAMRNLAGLAADPRELSSGIAPAGFDGYRMVFVGGRFRPELSNVLEASGVTFQPLRTALNDNATSAIARLPFADGDIIGALATTFATDGALIDIAPGTKLDKPLHLVTLAEDRAPALSVLRNAIKVGDGADITLIEVYSDSEPGQSLGTLRIEVGANATLRHLRVGEGGTGTYLLSTSAEIGAGGAYDPVHLVIGGALTRAQNSVTFNGENARCRFNGAMLLGGREHADFTLLIDHAVPSCESRETVKAVLDGESRGVFQAKVIVRPGAQKTDGRQLANGLLLSETAEFDAKPELEIYADDVKCNHGATSGALDDDMLFYLRSRGIPEADAKSLLVLAFVGEIIDQIEDEGWREALMAKAAQWLASAGDRKGRSRA